VRKSWIFFTKFGFKSAHGVGCFVQFGKLADGFRFQRLDARFQTPRRHREVRAQLVLVGLNFRYRQGSCCFQPLHGEPHGTALDEGDDEKPDEGCDEKPDPEIHDRFDHRPAPLSQSPRSKCHRIHDMGANMLRAWTEINLNAVGSNGVTSGDIN
jgi:hypothetical protein